MFLLPFFEIVACGLLSASNCSGNESQGHNWDEHIVFIQSTVNKSINFTTCHLDPYALSTVFRR